MLRKNATSPQHTESACFGYLASLSRLTFQVLSPSHQRQSVSVGRVIDNEKLIINYNYSESCPDTRNRD